jgi:hypothetical protein
MNNEFTTQTKQRTIKMRISIAILVLFLAGSTTARSSRPSTSASRRPPTGRRSSSRQPPSAPSRRRRQSDYDDILSDDDPTDNDQDYDDYEDDEILDRRPPPPSRSRRTRRDDDDYRPSSRRRSSQVVPYNRRRPPQPSAFTRGLSAIRDKMPDPTTVKETVLTATKTAQQSTAKLGSNLYREVKGLTSSELEQVMLKATRPDDEPVKSKHVERLVGVTYQISGKYDIYDAVLRKLWNKMAEKDIRTKLKSVYVLHRFSVDGGMEHREALKQRLRALRKTKDPKRSGGGKGGTRYFDSKVLIGADSDVSYKIVFCWGNFVNVQGSWNRVMYVFEQAITDW